MLSRVILLLSVGRKRKTDLVAPNQHSRGQTNEYSKEVAAGGERFFLFFFFLFYKFSLERTREDAVRQCNHIQKRYINFFFFEYTILVSRSP